MLMNSFEVLRLGDRDERMPQCYFGDRGPEGPELDTGLYFTYQAVEAVAESASRYFTDGVAARQSKRPACRDPRPYLREPKKRTGLNVTMCWRLTALKNGHPTRRQSLE